MLNLLEISSSDLPTVDKKEEGQFTIQEIVYLNEDLKNYEEVAFFEVNPDKQLFEKLYVKKNKQN